MGKTSNIDDTDVLTEVFLTKRVTVNEFECEVVSACQGTVLSLLNLQVMVS